MHFLVSATAAHQQRRGHRSQRKMNASPAIIMIHFFRRQNTDGRMDVDRCSVFVADTVEMSLEIGLTHAHKFRITNFYNSFCCTTLHVIRGLPGTAVALLLLLISIFSNIKNNIWPKEAEDETKILFFSCSVCCRLPLHAYYWFTAACIHSTNTGWYLVCMPSRAPEWSHEFWRSDLQILLILLVYVWRVPYALCGLHSFVCPLHCRWSVGAKRKEYNGQKTYAFQSQILDNISWIVYFRIELHQTKQ